MLAVVVTGLVVLGAAAVFFPDRLAELAAKEGPIEHLSHAVLGVGVVAWAVIAIRRRSIEAGVLAAWCAVVLGEELDWGGVYGWVRDGGNVHNAWHGASYLLFAIPVLAVVGVAGWRRGGGPGRRPRRNDAVGLLVLGLAALGGTLAWPAHEAVLDETTEAVLYVGVVWLAVRPRPPSPDQSS